MGRLWLQSLRPVPLEEPRAPRAEADVTVLRPRDSAWTRELRLRPLPGQDMDAMRLLVDRLQDMLAVPLPFLAKVSFQLLLSRPAQDPFKDGRQRGLEFQHYFLKLAPSPAARAGAMMAAIRSKLGISDGAHAAAGGDPRAPAAERGGRLLEGAAREPGQEEGRLEPPERGPPLLHVVRLGSLPRRGQAHQRAEVEGRNLLRLLLLPRAGPPPRAPPCRQAARSTDRPVAGRVEVFVFAWQRTQWQDGQEYFHILQQRAPANQGSAEHTALLLLDQGHFALIHNFQALASRRGVALGATPSNSGGKEYKCPKCMARFTKKASWQRHKRQHLLRYKPKASLAPAPSVHVARRSPPARPPWRPPATWRSGAAATSRPRS